MRSPVVGGYGNRWASMRIRMPSGKVASDDWSQPVREDERQPLPQPRRALKPRVRRTQVGKTRTIQENVLIGQRHRVEAPVTLEVVRPCALAATAEIEDAAAALCCAAHQLPVHEVVDALDERQA